MKKNTSKKKQHFVPKFYLRYFSWQEKKQIGVYNLRSKKYFDQATLRDLGSKHFFYGKDGKLEDRFSNLESKFSITLNQIIVSKSPPKYHTDEHSNLLLFLATSHLRNPIAIDSIRTLTKDMKQLLMTEYPESDFSDEIPDTSHEDAIRLSLNALIEIVELMTDLKIKLLVNKSETSFITSDFPIVKYNQLLEKIKWKHGRTGYALYGFQILLPLTPRLCLIIYDSLIYKVGTKKSTHVVISDKKDVDSINQLQVVNCYSSLFFDYTVSEKYIRTLVNSCSNFKKANVPTTFLSKLHSYGNQRIDSKKNNLVVSGSSACETNFNIKCLKMHSNSKKIINEIQCSSKVAPIRPLAYVLLENRR